MKSHLMILIGLGFSISGCSNERISSQVADSVAARKTEEKLKETIIPSVEFSNIPLREALDFVQQKQVELDPDRKPARRGVSIVVEIPKSTAEVVESSSEEGPHFGFQANAPASTDSDLRITFTGQEISVWDALLQISKQSGISIRIDKLGRVRVEDLSAANKARDSSF